jgi:hypothetical protein
LNESTRGPSIPLLPAVEGDGALNELHDRSVHTIILRRRWGFSPQSPPLAHPLHLRHRPSAPSGPPGRPPSVRPPASTRATRVARLLAPFLALSPRKSAGPFWPIEPLAQTKCTVQRQTFFRANWRSQANGSPKGLCWLPYRRFFGRLRACRPF